MLAWYRRFSIKTLLLTIPVALVVALILLVISVLFTIFTGGKYVGTDIAADTPTASTQPVTPAPTPSTFDAPSGCLSQSSNPADFVLETQAVAPLTPTGAAEFAGAWVRWQVNTPRQRTDAVLDSTVVDPSSLRPVFQQNPGSGNSTATLAHAGVAMPSYGPNRATVNVGITSSRKDGENVNNFITISLQYVNGVWKVESATPLSATDDILRRMIPFTSGC